MKASILGFTVSHPSAEVSYLLCLWTERGLAGPTEGGGSGEREKVVCGFLSGQLGQQHTAPDEMDEIEAGVQKEVRRAGMGGRRGGGLLSKSPGGLWIDLEMSPSKSSYLLSD